MPTQNVQIEIRIPDYLDQIITTPLLAYRRIRFGCAFRLIPLTQGRFAKVDPEYYHRLSKYKWTFHDSQSTNGYYAVRTISQNGRQIKIWMHRQIMAYKLNTELCNLPADLVVDHINGNSLDNRKANLRLATQQQNLWNSNRGKNTGSSRYKGVTWDKSRARWRVRIKHKGRKLSFGYHKNEIDAAKAYDRAILKLRGPFAVLNFPKRKSKS